jgi:hypothetical protein
MEPFPRLITLKRHLSHLTVIFGRLGIAVMDYICCCLTRRKPIKPSSKSVTSSHSRLSDKLSFIQHVSGEGSKALTNLHEKCGENTSLSTAEARALLDQSGKFNAPLTPREIEELHRILSSPAPPQAGKPGTASSSGTERPPRTPTNQMLPDMQVQSDLFCLPAEVRAQIWRYALGGRKIYLAVRQGKLVQQSNMERPYWRHINGLLSVPLLCRKS